MLLRKEGYSMNNKILPVKKVSVKRFFVSLDIQSYKILEAEAKKNGFQRASNYARHIIVISLALNKFENSLPKKKAVKK